MSRICIPSRAKRRASWCTLVTSGQVASMAFSPRSFASAWTAGETPWAENTTVEPAGTSVQLLDEDRSALLEVFHDVPVVHDLLAHVHRRTVGLECFLDRHHRPVDAGTVPPRSRHDNAPPATPGVESVGERSEEVVAIMGGSLIGRLVAASRSLGTGCFTCRPGLSGPRISLPSMGLPSSPEHPQPLRVVAHAVRGYIDKLGPIWVEAQLIEINQGARSRLVFLTMRDTLAEVSVSVSISPSPSTRPAR